ncbi:MAG: hypothetical protein GF365_02065 [Candidatus Buchananbacteria bacterium]|nr:hypothetical protein [Candidatus Buchananbacteria bacterium]
MDCFYYNDFPLECDRADYQQRRIWFEIKTMCIRRVEMRFQNGKIDGADLKYEGSDQLIIDWVLFSGYLSQMNVNFF